MGALKQLYQSPGIEEGARGADSLTLYDRYGALAYGIILQIIPDTEVAQRVLVDLFSSPQMNAYTEFSHRVSSSIIRLARQKALDARPVTMTKPLAMPMLTVNDTTDKSVFDLSFYKGYTIEEIADKLQVSRANVLTRISAYFKNHRLS